MIYEKNSYVTGSMCDSKLKLSILAADEIVENAVTETMGDLGIDGIVAMEKYKAMWLIAKNSIRFFRRPVWREEFTVRCFISKFSAVKLMLDTIVEGKDGERLVHARTELAAIDLESQRIRKAETVGFTPDMAHPAEEGGPEFTRFPKTGTEPLETITVRSTSMDYCYHTNNIEYVRFMLNTYDISFLKSHDPVSLEIHYGSQSFAGENLTIEKLHAEDGDLFKIIRDETEITSCKISWHKEA
ncbi:MAG: acyl-ACP thioesterase [Clostridiales bacterium]|nr:acyl-ACP thioesterase [Clostridiales bacterium]